MPTFLPPSRLVLRTTLVCLALLAAWLTTGCSVRERDLVGVWQGYTTDTAYVFELRAGGEGRLEVTTGGRKVGYECKWALDGTRLWLRRPVATASFRIMEHSGDEMVVRVANGLGRLCRMRRVASQ